MRQRLISGRLQYVSDRPADRGRARGAETFTIGVDSDGTTTQRALSFIDDAPVVQRDVVQTMNRDLRPRDCFVRIRVGAEAPIAEGAGWFRFGTVEAACEAHTSAEGRVSQSHRLAGGPLVFCNHAIAGDAAMMAAYPLSAGPGRILVRDMLLPTLNKQGATGPMLAHAELGIAYVGTERISVPAGAFDCLHFQTNAVPPGTALADATLSYDMWCTADGLYIPVVSGYRDDRRYELVTLTTD
jgi:hypothetical protein